MSKQKKKNMQRSKKFVVILSLTAVILTVSTYAWFVGLQIVSVSSFDVRIAATDSLLLSLDGENWRSIVSISKETLDEVSYTGHTNSWGGEGLIPISSTAEMDPNVSRMKLFEKTSLTATPGGYRLISNRIDNSGPGQPEQDGYVVFDLFVKNSSGSQYIKELNVLDEEAIYLTTDSEVTVAEAGVADTGIENSVRVAFGQIGRVNANTSDVGIITGITCTSDENVTGICRGAVIWEPNDTAHNANAIKWYNASCKARTGTDVTSSESYDGPCGTVIDGEYYPTYVVASEVTSADNVDVYDGAEYNGYIRQDNLLVAFPTLTDTMKLQSGTDRPKLMTLSPNSITKLRIYIYLEGQDIDNYDYASIGKKIAVNFGFVKQRFVEDDINYDGPPLNPEEDPIEP